MKKTRRVSLFTRKELLNDGGSGKLKNSFPLVLCNIFVMMTAMLKIYIVVPKSSIHYYNI